MAKLLGDGGLSSLTKAILFLSDRLALLFK